MIHLTSPLGITSLLLASAVGLFSVTATVQDGCEPEEPAPCEGPEPVGEPFSSGPYGIEPWNIAADFTLPTLEGDWRFSDNWTGCDSYVFLSYYRTWDYSVILWNSSIRDLLEDSPKNVHYFIMSYDTGGNVMEDITALKAKVDGALATLSDADAAHWAERFHYVTQGVFEMDNWISQKLEARSFFSFAIDRDQKVREVGSLYGISDVGLWIPLIRMAALEPEYYNFEWDREQRLQSVQATLVPVFEQEPVSDPGWAGVSAYADVTFPDLSAFDTMELDLGIYCPDHYDENCPEWDYDINLYLCDQDDPDRCDTIFARWITTYGREGRWVTDASGMLALLGAGGPHRFRFYSTQYYLLDLTIRLSHQGIRARPDEATYLWSGGAFNETYNDQHDPITLFVPNDVTKVELYALITGHGWGAEVDNCAEFCNHQHHFVINGVEYVEEFPEAGTTYGCEHNVGGGTVPNQYGTWFYGRGGWCPGLDVAPFTVDVTDSIIPGAENALDYYALMDGEVYIPEPSGSGDGFNAQIDMQSWLVYYR